MRILKAIWIFLKWLLYAILTSDARSRYNMAVTRGMHCYKTTNGLGYTDFHYDPSRKPFREYMTWREFWIANGWKHTAFSEFKNVFQEASLPELGNTNCRYFFTPEEKNKLQSAIKFLERKGYAYWGAIQPIYPGHYGLIKWHDGRTELTICIKQK